MCALTNHEPSLESLFTMSSYFLRIEGGEDGYEGSGKDLPCSAPLLFISAAVRVCALRMPIGFRNPRF